MTSPIPPENPGSASPPSPGADLWARATPATAAADARTAASSGWEREVLEKLVFATINEQRASRRWRLFGRLLWTALILVVLWVLFAKDTATTTSSSPHTAVVEVKGEIAAGADASAEFVVAAMRRDRKSTRLNSSHSQISYAVFCLKKKKKTQVMHTPTNP